MNVSFVNYDPFEQPVLILKTAHGDTIGVIGSAENVGIDINYNEVSTIEFDITDRINGEVMPYYDQAVGMRIIELVDIGQFILMNPDEVDTGELRRKKCKCNSLEYEFTYKKITLPENTYRLWDPSGKEVTVVSMIMEQMPSWRVEFVSESLQYAYRTFSVSNDNLYNFIKGTVQKSFGCVFEFDTFARTVRIIDVNADAETRPVLISHENLAKEIDIKENTDNLFTRLDVNGADGVDIRSVNPAGTNKLINLDYFMTKVNFSTALINKYNQWKQSWKNNITPYRYLTIRHSAAVMQKITEQSALLDLKNELTDVENEQAVIIQAIASGLKTQADLNDVNVRVKRKKEEIAAKENEIKNIERQIEDIISEMKAVQNQCSFEAHFTADEMAILTPYIRDGEVSESSFVVTDNASYTDAGSGIWVDSLIVSITRSATRMTSSTSGSEIYDVRGGSISIGNNVTGSIVSAIADVKADGSVVVSIRVGSGLTDGNEFDGASITIVGSLHSNTNNAAQNGDTGDYEISDIEFVIRDAYEYFTLDVSEYDKRSVSQDLMEYGIDVLERLAWPKYSFNVSLANFFAIKDFVDFKNQLRLGAKIDLVAGEDKALSPICTGISMNYNNPSSLTMRFGDTYSANDSKFSLLDLLEKSVSMGKNVDVSKFNYSSFVNSGAKTNIKKFMESALDVAKNAILSSGRQAITWDGAGFRLRKWANDNKTAYDDEQIWMNNNSIMLTDDNWNTAKMAIGKFKDANLGDCWGVVAPMIVGTLIAGSELIIESAKKDGETSVFRMDGDGCRLYNSQMDIHNEAAHITLNPDTGIAIGQYPVCDPETKEVNENNANFWVDSNGNVHMRGTLHGANGEFTGRVTATELIIQSGNNKSQTINEYLSDNIQIGGTNLLRATGVTVNNGGACIEQAKTYYCRSGKAIRFNPLPASGQIDISQLQAVNLRKGKHTISFHAWSEGMDETGEIVVRFNLYDGENGYDEIKFSATLDEKYQRFEGTFELGGNLFAYPRFLIGTASAFTKGNVYITDWKLEAGDRATDWTPAPEDTDAAISALHTEVFTEFAVQRGLIKSKVEQTTFNALGEQVASNTSAISQTPEQIQAAVKSVQIGGRNLLRNTATLKKENYSFNNSSDSSANIGFGSTTEDEYGGFHIVCKNQNVRWQVTELPVTPGQSYVMSVQYKINSGTPPIQFQYIFKTAAGTTLHYWDSVNHSQVDTRMEDGWTVMTSVFTVPDNAAIAIMRLAIRTGKDNTAYTCDYNIRRPQLEAGNKATDWSPAPEDVAGEIESVKTAVLNITPEYIVQEVRKSTKYQEDLASLTLTADQIVSTVRGHKAYQDDLGDKADTKYVTDNFSTITQTEDSIKAAVDSVQIGGTNLVRCGEEMIGTVRGVIDREWSKSAYCRSGVGIIFQPFTGTYNGAHFYTDMTVEPGKYMLSFWCWTHAIDVQPTLRCNLWGKGNGIDYYFKDIQPTANTPKRYEIPIEVTYTATVNLRLLTWTKFTAGEIYVTDVQLEKGTKATDWSPAPEDTDVAISKVSAQLAIEAGNISANATAIQNANNAAADAKSAADTAQSLANTAQAAANAAQNAANDAKGIANGAVTRISTAESSISGLKSEISNKVTITEVNAAIGNIALGGTNLARCATDTIWVRYGSVDYERAESKSCRSGVAAVMSAWSGSHNEIRYNSNIDIEPGVYTVSFWCWHTGVNASVVIRPNIHADNSACDQYYDTLKFAPNANTPKKHSLQLNVTYTGRVRFRFVTMTPWSAGEVYFTDLKFEKGNKATDWSPCPYDTDGAISGIAGRVTSAETVISGHSESIKNMVTTTDFNALKKVVSSHGTSIENSSDEILMLASRTVGGTNLLRNTGTLKTANHAIDESGASARGKCTEDEFGGFHVVCKDQNIRCWMGDFVVIPGQSYAMSVRYKINSGSPSIQFQYVFKSASGTDLYFWNSVNHGKTTTLTEDGWTVLRNVVEVPDNSAVGKVSLAIRTGVDGKLYTCDYNIRRPKFEAGSMPTDWSPSPYDPSNSLDTGENSSVKVRITSDTFDIDVPGTDGDFTLNKTGARIPVLNADMVSAKNLAYRYNGSSTLYVNPNATSAQLAAGNYYRSFVDACAAVSGRYLDYNVSILVQGTTYGEALLSGIVGTGAVYIHGNGHSLIGQLKMQHCSVGIYISNIAVSLPSSSAATCAVEICGCQYVTLESSVKLTGKGTNTALYVVGGSTVWMHDCELYNATQLLYALYGTHVTALNMKGGNCTNYAWANGAILKMAGSRPDGTLRVANAALTVPADPNTLTVNYGTAQPSVPVIQTATYNYTSSDSYRGGWSYFSDEDIHQGYDGGTIYGVIWFDAATIKSALSGKTISQASLRLHMAKNVGRGVAVNVQLYGTNMAYSGRSGQPALTTSYGTIGTTEPDVTNEITIPTAVISDIVSGKIQALVLKSDDTTTYKDRFYSQNYAKFYGSTSATTANCPRLTVVYQ